MLNKLSVLTLVIPFVSAITLQAVQPAFSDSITPTGQIAISYTVSRGDPTVFNFIIVNTVNQASFFVQAENVTRAFQTPTQTLFPAPTLYGTVGAAMPNVPVGDNYVLEAVSTTDNSNVFATSPSFSVVAAPATSSTASDTTSYVWVTASGYTGGRYQTVTMTPSPVGAPTSSGTQTRYTTGSASSPAGSTGLPTSGNSTSSEDNAGSPNSAPVRFSAGLSSWAASVILAFIFAGMAF